MSKDNNSPESASAEIQQLRDRIAELERENRRYRAIELELATSEMRLQSILDASTAVIYVKDVEGRYFTINRHYERLFGISREDILGQTDYEIFPSDVADAFRANDRKVVEAQKALEFEEIAPHDDGPHTYLSIKFPLRDSAGTLYAVCGISTDITERKETERKLREALATLDDRKRKR